MKYIEEDTMWSDIYIAGDIDECKRICAHYCYRTGLCVNISETEYIYTGGREKGMKIGLINYPRFPTSHPDTLHTKALRLAEHLIEELAQHSATVQSTHATAWLTRRKEDG